MDILENFLSIFLANKEKNTKNPYQEAMDYYAQIDTERYGLEKTIVNLIKRLSNYLFIITLQAVSKCLVIFGMPGFKFPFFLTSVFFI